MARKRKSIDTEHARELLESGQTLNQVAATLGVHPDNLSKKLRAVGIKTDFRVGRIRPVLEIDMGPIVAAYEGGESLLSISKRTGIERIVLTPRLRRLGIRIRGGSEANEIRFAKASPAERQAIVAKAHDAVRGVRRTDKELLLRAQARSRIVGVGEVEILEALLAVGEDAEGQRPCGKYNIDVAFAHVAVEVCGFHPGRPTDAIYLKRCKDIADAGYAVVLVCFQRREALFGNLDNVIGQLQVAKADPSSPRKHWVIRCASNRFTRVRNDKGQFSVVPAPETFFYTVRELHL